MHDTTGNPAHPLTRRTFLARGLTLASLTSTAPLFIERSAHAMARPFDSLLTSQPGVPQDRVLVVVQLGGGNDGLNTVVPYGSSRYYDLRPTLAVPAPGRGTQRAPAALTLDEDAGIGLHPALGDLKTLFDDGAAAIVQGVGYPNPNRSHFTSMDVWHTARPDATGNGWLGRYFDHTCAGEPKPDGAVSIGATAPLALVGDEHRPVTFESAEMFRWVGNEVDPSLAGAYDAINRAGAPAAAADTGTDGTSQLDFLRRTSLDAQLTSDRIRRAMDQTPLVSYPGGRLAGQLRTVAAMIRDAMPTRVYYVSLGGFDTHANQAGSHANLLRQLGQGLHAFQRDLRAQGNAGRVLTMVFSEFGRRVAQNGSGGTDHGTAAPMYLVGDPVVPGLHGQHPSLTQLDEGDLRHAVDFRSVYATVLEDWMGADARPILGGRYKKLKVVRA